MQVEKESKSVGLEKNGGKGGLYMAEYLHFQNAIFCSSNCSFLRFSALNLSLFMYFSLFIFNNVFTTLSFLSRSRNAILVKTKSDNQGNTAELIIGHMPESLVQILAPLFKDLLTFSDIQVKITDEERPVLTKRSVVQGGRIELLAKFFIHDALRQKLYQ